MVDTARTTTAQSQASPTAKPPEASSLAKSQDKHKTTATKPDNSKTNKPKESSGSGCLIWLFFLAILGASGYLYLRMERPDILNIASDNVDKFYIYDDDSNDRISELERRLDNLSKAQNEHGYKQDIQRLSDGQQAIIKRLDEQENNISSSAPPNVQIQLAELALRTSGDVATAVNTLRLIKVDNPAALEAEISRLEKIPNREKILLQIKEIRTLTGKIKTNTTTDSIIGTIVSLFNIRKEKNKKTEKLQEHLKNMELQLLAGHKEDYLNSLSAAANLWQEVAGETPDANITGLFGFLLEYGAPDYQLQIDGF